MSADNRILIYQKPEDARYYVWEGSCSMNYFEPPNGSISFFNKEQAETAAFYIRKDLLICEGDIQELTDAEVIEGLKEQLNNPYCRKCNACGEDGPKFQKTP